MGKRVNKILWHGNELNADGTPKPPVAAAEGGDGLDGLNSGEVYIHEGDDSPGIFIRTSSGRIVSIGGADIETLAKTFLRKDQEDQTSYLLKLLGGAEFGTYSDGVSGGKVDEQGTAELLSLMLRSALKSYGYTSGALGSGFFLGKDENGDAYLEIDRMLVRKVATFVELLIQELRHVGGQIVLSPASMQCSKVEDMGTYYRCYFENTDGDKTINQEFVVNDQARCQTFNIKEGVNENVTNTYYWRLVVGVGDNYIDLSKADCDAGSTVPQAGDDIVQLGNRTDTTRQGAIVLSAYGADSPSIKLYKGINSYSLAGKERISLSPQAVNIIADSLKFSTGENVKDELDTAKEDAAQAATDAANAAQDAQDAKDRLDDWADDGVISPTEKQGLKDEIARIKGDYDEINAGYSKYGLGTPSTYNSAYNSYLSVLTTLSASSPEVITIPSYFASRQTTYYTQRTNALNAIATAAKDYVDGLGDTVTETVMEAVDGKITLAVNTKVEDAQGEIMQEVNSQLQVLEGQISSKVSTTTFTQEKASILNTAQGYANNALTSAKNDAASKYATISTMNTMSTRIDQLSNSISLKADSSTVTSLVNDYGDLQEHVADLETRVNSAELKITPDAIISTVSSSVPVKKKVTVDATGLNSNLYYPVTMKIPVSTVTITVERYLDASYGKPSYSTHTGGFSVRCVWVTNGSAWGVISISRYVQSWNYSFSNVVPIGTIGQMTNSSNEYIYVRGGSKYDITIEGTNNATITLRTSNFTESSQTISAGISSVSTPVVDLLERPTEDELVSHMIQTPNGFTFYGKEVNIKASILTAENIAALNISTGNLTVKTGAKIGGWTVNGSNLEVTGDNTAKIRVEPSGTKFLRINSSTSTLLEMRADSMTGLRIYTQDTLGTCVNLMAQTGGIAMESHGNMALDARQGESIQLNGDVRVQGLTLGTTRRGANYQVLYNETFISIPYGCTITLPANPPIGRVVIAASSTTSTVTYTAATGFIMYKGVYQTSWQDTNDHSWNIFIWDGTYWQRLLMKQ